MAASGFDQRAPKTEPNMKDRFPASSAAAARKNPEHRAAETRLQLSPAQPADRPAVRPEALGDRQYQVTANLPARIVLATGVSLEFLEQAGKVKADVVDRALAIGAGTGKVENPAPYTGGSGQFEGPQRGDRIGARRSTHRSRLPTLIAPHDLKRPAMNQRSRSRRARSDLFSPIRLPSCWRYETDGSAQ